MSNVIVQLPLAYRDQLLRGGRVYIEWSSYKVSAWESVPRCLACMGYGHSIKECRSERLCFRCARRPSVATTAIRGSCLPATPPRPESARST